MVAEASDHLAVVELALDPQRAAVQPLLVGRLGLPQDQVELDAPALRVPEDLLPLVQAADVVVAVVEGAPGEAQEGSDVLAVAPEVHQDRVDRVDPLGGQVIERPGEAPGVVAGGVAGEGLVPRAPVLPVRLEAVEDAQVARVLSVVEAQVTEQVLGAVGATLDEVGPVAELQVVPADVLEPPPPEEARRRRIARQDVEVPDGAVGPDR